MTKLNYSAKDILQKEFKSKVRGYDPIEVDEFLDNVIKDYETYNQELLALKEENHRLVNKVDQLTQNQASLSRMKQETPAATKNTSVTNFDILKRLSNLEKHVFGGKLEEKKIDITVNEQVRAQGGTTLDEELVNRQARASLANAVDKVLKGNDDLDMTRRF
ncbi:cell division regulator GpsB [Vagococcus jeotgali]|uniref:cell division regulator GpsB n=1 Tax=Vagococcus jeotgali TaxID=3109030 RepID=UPI002DD7FAA4|nr:cell division regulator GpsB [Vagococcus sp. B2T-5]